MKLSTRAWIFAAAFFALVFVVALGASAKLTPDQASQLNQTVSGLGHGTLAIFFNNARVDLIEFVPILGPAFGVYVSYNTGLAIEAITQSSSIQGISAIEAFLALMLTPIFWMEFFSYSLAVEESFAILIAARKKEDLSVELRWLVGSLLLAMAVLFVSARLESSIVGMFG
ncbi:MAG: hypothetical protein M1587_11640 [Thaumarchaeota archaeon]|nr:hypothetical protein [Nitrososphaerota archaeon]MCL5068165.1 hypothetical protein [Nitrososphaerota archaeon]